jgi:hypothetical protein
VASEEDEQNPWTRPGFVSAALVIAIIVLCGAVLGIKSLSDGDTASAAASASTTPTPTPTPIPTPTTGQRSICGLADDTSNATAVASAPTAVWKYQGTTSYPTSDSYGPGATQGAVRYCFQHSVTGALFAAANAVAQGSDDDNVHAWLEYAVANCPNRQQAIATGSDTGDDSDNGTRIQIQGYRVLFYDGDTASIDIGLVGVGGGQTLLASVVYKLVWQDGDWKMWVDDPDHPIDIAQVTDLNGYTTWGE